MYLIRRTKTATKDGEPVGKPKTHYAAAVAKAGNVTAWVDDRAKAKEFDAAAVEHVEAYYFAKAEAGQPVGDVEGVRLNPGPPVTREEKVPPAAVAGDDEAA